jgi:hypothetical protein
MALDLELSLQMQWSGLRILDRFFCAACKTNNNAVLDVAPVVRLNAVVRALDRFFCCLQHSFRY